MSAPADPLQTALDALTGGAVVDWDELEASATDPAARDTIHRLRVIARVAHAHEFVALERERPLDAFQLAAPCAWGPLHVIEPLARGAYGEVYRAWDPRLEREVALKLLDEHSAEDASLAVREGRLLARVRHPNVVAVYGADVVDGRVGLWMEFVRGATLDALVRRDGPFHFADAITSTIALCRALDAVHVAGLVHRDVKAQNVMRDEDGRVVLMDFGTGQETHETGDGSLMGTPVYVAPEVLAGGPATRQSDVYSVGVLLVFLLTGRYAVEGAPVGQPTGLASLIDRATASNPAERFPDAAALATSLAGVLERHSQRPRRRRLLTAGAATAVIVVALVTTFAVRVRSARRVSAEARRAYALSQDLASRGQWRPAVDAARQSVQIDPRFASGHIWLAWCLRRTAAAQDDVVAEAARAEQYVAAEPLREQYWIRGTAAYLRGRFVDAVQQYVGLLTIDPDHVWGLENALAAAREWKPPETARIAPFAAKRADLHPADFTAAARAADAFLESGNDAQAEAYFARARALRSTAQPLPEFVLMFPVREAYLRGDVHGAVVKLGEGLARIRTPDGHVQRGLASSFASYLLLLGRCEEATRVASDIPSRVEQPLRLASIAFRCGDARAFRERLAGVEKTDPRAAMLLIAGGLLSDVQRLSDIARGPRHPTLLPAQEQELAVIEGRLELARGHVAEAVGILKRALPSLSSPFYQERYAGLAEAFLSQGDTAAALASLRESVIYTAPSESQTRLGWIDNAERLTELYQQLGRDVEATELKARLRPLLSEADPDFQPLMRFRRLEAE